MTGFAAVANRGASKNDNENCIVIGGIISGAAVVIASVLVLTLVVFKKNENNDDTQGNNNTVASNDDRFIFNCSNDILEESNYRNEIICQTSLAPIGQISYIKSANITYFNYIKFANTIRHLFYELNIIHNNDNNTITNNICASQTITSYICQYSENQNCNNARNKFSTIFNNMQQLSTLKLIENESKSCIYQNQTMICDNYLNKFPLGLSGVESNDTTTVTGEILSAFLNSEYCG